MAIPTKDSLLVPYSTNVDTRINAQPADFGLVIGQATAYTALHTPYVNAYNAMMQARADGTRSKSLTEAKDNAKLNLLTYAREIYSFVQANTSVTDENKILLGIKVKDNTPTPAPVPTTAPAVDITVVGGNTIKVILREAGQTKHGKPAFVKGAAVYYYVGEETPGADTPWITFANTGRTIFNMEFPSSLAKGTQVWIIASWFNNRGQFGPSSTPQSTLLLGQSTFQSGNLKLAA